MVFLAPACFNDRGELADEDVFAVQERIGPLPWRDAGYLYPQAYFYDARRLPEWWTGPSPESYRVLHGSLPDEARPTAARLHAIETRFLREDLSRQLDAMVKNFIDADDVSLPRRVRLLGTAVTPAVFALISHDAEDALEIWALPKFEALARLEARYPDAEGPRLARRFYEQMVQLYGETFDAHLARDAFRTGVAFLRWAEGIGQRL